MKKIHWVNTLFLTITPIVGITGLITLICLDLFTWQTALFAMIFAYINGLCITAGYHRLFSHKSYQAHWSVRLFFLLFGAATFEGSALDWCADHRDHHKYTDTNKDPYNINQGFWYAHIGWLIFYNPSRRNLQNVTDLSQDRLVRLQHRFYPYIAIFMGFIVPTLICTLWGDALGGLLIAGAFRISIEQHFTFFINSVSHYFGKRPYSKEETARDNWFAAFLTFGEGYHNFHHKFPIDYRNGIKLYHWDPTKWLIRALAFLGLAKNLRRINTQRIIKLRLETDLSLVKQIIINSSNDMKENLVKSMQGIYNSVLQKLAHFEELEKHYKELKRSNMQKMHDKLDQYRQQLRMTKLELKELLSHWAQCRQNLLNTVMTE